MAVGTAATIIAKASTGRRLRDRRPVRLFAEPTPGRRVLLMWFPAVWLRAAGPWGESGKPSAPRPRSPTSSPSQRPPS